MAAYGFSNRPLVAPDIAQGVVYMLQQPRNISVRALDVVSSGMVFVCLRPIDHCL